MVNANELANVIAKAIDNIKPEAFEGFEDYDGERIEVEWASQSVETDTINVWIRASMNEWRTEKSFKVTVEDMNDYASAAKTRGTDSPTS